MLKKLEKYTKFFDKKWGSPTYFDLQGPPKFCPFPCIFRFSRKQAQSWCINDLNFVNMDWKVNLARIFLNAPPIFRKLALQGVHCQVQIVKFCRQINFNLYEKLWEDVFIYKKSNKRKKYGAYGLRFARILESVIFVSYISADFLLPVRKWINQKWITTSKGPCDRNIRFISERGCSVWWSENCLEFPLIFNTV